MKKLAKVLGLAISLSLTLSLMSCNNKDTDGNNEPSSEKVIAPMEGDDIFSEKQPWN